MKDAVAKRSAVSAAMMASADKGRALMGGTDAMRAKGKTYLPKFEAEKEDDYTARRDSSWLFNGYSKTARDMTGRIFDKPVELTAPPQIETWCDNVDLQGRDLSTFARDVFQDGITGPGISYILVDAPPRDMVVTKTQAETMGLRPYMVHLRVEDVLGWRTMVVGNVTVLAQLRIHETICLPDPKDEFAEVELEQVRVLDRTETGVQVRLFRKASGMLGSQWVMEGEPAMTGLPEITVVPFYANWAGFFTGRPMLSDLAEANIAHWQVQSDYRNINHVVCTPVLFGAGFSSEDKLVVSPHTATISSNDAAKLTWVEHTGAGIASVERLLAKLELQMEAYGLQLVAGQTEAQSATGAALDATKETSALSMTADALKDALEQALIWMAQYGGLPDVGMEAKVNKDFGAGMMTPQEMTVLLSAVNTGNLSRETFLGELSRRKVIAPETDVQDEAERIVTEGGNLVAQ